MSYPPPTVFSAAAQTNAVAFTYTSHVLVAAPGAGFRFRVVAFHLVKWITVGGVGPDVLAWLQGSVSALVPVDHILAVDLRANVAATATIPEGGYPYDPNRALSVGSISTIANSQFFVSVSYYVDAV